jgi:cytochrome bd-type quinol oxidase subunit 2
MKKNWFQRNLGLTMVIAGGLIYTFEKTFSKEFPEHEWLVALSALGVFILLDMWLLTQKGRSFWWLLLIIPVPVAYFFLKNNLEIPQSTKL